MVRGRGCAGDKVRARISVRTQPQRLTSIASAIKRVDTAFQCSTDPRATNKAPSATPVAARAGPTSDSVRLAVTRKTGDHAGRACWGDAAVRRAIMGNLKRRLMRAANVAAMAFVATLAVSDTARGVVFTSGAVGDMGSITFSGTVVTAISLDVLATADGTPPSAGGDLNLWTTGAMPAST